MLDPAIQAFLHERKQGWLKKKINSKTTEAEQLDFEREANEHFALATWLPDAAKRAKQLFLVSHPSKFSHPSAKTSSIIAQAKPAPDGYLRTGNVTVELDVFGNAAAMDVYKFLSLELQDGQTVLQHLEQASPSIQQQLHTPEHSFESLAAELLMIKESATQQQTSGKVKQVYFPINAAHDEYHLLSVLTSSGIMYELKKRIRELRFSETAQQAFQAEKDNAFCEHGYADVRNLTSIGFGGTKPQNISVLNSQNGGVASLLASVPPALDPKKLSPPKHDFFSTLRLFHYQEDFHQLHTSLLQDTHNIHIRKQRKGLMKRIIYQVIDQSWRIRYLEAGWSQAERCEALPLYQKLWLDQHYRDSEARNDWDTWLGKVQTELARWFIQSYEKVLKKEAIELGDDELMRLQQVIAECEEALK